MGRVRRGGGCGGWPPGRPGRPGQGRPDVQGLRPIPKRVPRSGARAARSGAWVYRLRLLRLAGPRGLYYEARPVGKARPPCVGHRPHQPREAAGPCTSSRFMLYSARFSARFGILGAELVLRAHFWHRECEFAPRTAGQPGPRTGRSLTGRRPSAAPNPAIRGSGVPVRRGPRPGRRPPWRARRRPLR